MSDMTGDYYSLEVWLPIFINAILSLSFYLITSRIIPKLCPMFINARLYGFDLNKTNSEKVPEALGVVAGCMYLIAMFLFIPIPFGSAVLQNSYFPHDELVKLVAALLSICCMLLLGFADDVLDLRWRHKLLLPTVASLPLLMVYYVTYNSTTIIVPKPLRLAFGFSVNLGVLYYLFMSLLAVFCTNAINILAGVNGLEAGQSIVIAMSLATFNFCELSGEQWRTHQFSLFFLMPFIAVNLALLKYNWYPSRVFVGDTFCYFAGMTFAVVGILGIFSKTLLLFFIPQVVNFLYSVPQLFHILPCPRHRMPRMNKISGLLEASKFECKEDELTSLGRLILDVAGKLSLVQLSRKDGVISGNNLTIINFVLVKVGPLHEAHLTSVLLTIQVLCSGLAFLIRYPMASIFYDVPR
ncbi:hypothetical protein GE061_013709 [Apolygus lucorum]|uniref:UDP-N-acetylglucosamine--dolichyl-phosphate N-acetylglucosaminephosphotransferase n=1 Tax=Apolygus lucorum TaxID=248454 RepID=A0A6A4K897_APOLU|nr:hypothetical protein GE061_013709 [Apolygus lucorum]